MRQREIQKERNTCKLSAGFQKLEIRVPFQLYQNTVDVYVVTSDKYIERKRDRNKSLANTQRLILRLTIAVTVHTLYILFSVATHGESTAIISESSLCFEHRFDKATIAANDGKCTLFR